MPDIAGQPTEIGRLSFRNTRDSELLGDAIGDVAAIVGVVAHVMRAARNNPGPFQMPAKRDDPVKDRGALVALQIVNPVEMLAAKYSRQCEPAADLPRLQPLVEQHLVEIAAMSVEIGKTRCRQRGDPIGGVMSVERAKRAHAEDHVAKAAIADNQDLPHRASVVDLKFPSFLWQPRLGTSNPNHTRFNGLLVCFRIRNSPKAKPEMQRISDSAH